MMTFLAVIHILACFGLIGLVLIQDSKGGGVFTSQASSNSVLGANGATTLAQTMTKALAALFAITCIGLSIMAARTEKSVVDSMPAAATTQALPPPSQTVPPPAGSPTEVAQPAQPAAVTPAAPAEPKK